MNFLEELSWRGMLHDKSPGVETLLNNKICSAYIGFDMTADSLHIGNLASLMLLKHFQNCGHKVYALIGGATSLVGDPSFKSNERVLLNKEEISHRKVSIVKQIEKILDCSRGNFMGVLDNYDWIGNISFIDFLRDVGKYITVNYMQAKDSVKNRMQTGISFTEFSYQLLQAYDFYYLCLNKNVEIQMGGSDQWGNLTTGLELLRKKSQKEAFVLTTPLITKADGTKFGKSEQGTNIWLDRNKTTPYEFYQFWYNSSDQDAEKYIKIFTTLTFDEVEKIIDEHKKNPEARALQSRLAHEVTKIVHSEEDCKNIIQTSKAIFGGDVDISSMSREVFESAFSSVPKIVVQKSAVLDNPIDILLTSLTNNQIFSSKSELRRMADSGGLLINKKKIIELSSKILDIVIFEKYIVVQKGKKNYFLLELS